jgi:acetyltransferase-like isoleucine patch superfamily enzyme
MRFLHSILNRLENRFGNSDVRYSIGNIKHHNSLVDSVVPQFVRIGDNFISGPNSMIVAHDASYFIHSGKYRIQPVTIGDNVFLGAGAIVMPGVTVGNRVVIGAGSIVTKDIPDNSVAVGNPAKVIGTVDEYIAKAEAAGCLFTPPFDLGTITKQGGRADDSQLLAFQKKACEEYRKRNPGKNEWIRFD